MAIRDVASYLTRFDAPQPLLRPQTQDVLFEAPAFESLEHSESRDMQLRDELQSEFDARLAQARADFEVRLEDERQKWTEGEAQALAQKLTQALNEALESLRVDVSRVLTPFVSRRLSALILDDLVTTVRAGLANESAPAVEISGPPDFVGKLGAALAHEGVAMTRRESDGIDATITFDATTIETRLGEWVARIANGEDKDHE